MKNNRKCLRLATVASLFMLLLFFPTIQTMNSGQGSHLIPGNVQPASAVTFARIGNLSMATGENFLYSASAIDTAAGFAYFGTYDNATIIKVRLSNFTRVGSIVLNLINSPLYSAVIDPTGGYAYFGAGTAPGTIFRIRLSDFTLQGNVTLNAGEDFVYGGVIDPAGGFAYFGLGTTPGMIAKIALSTFTRSAVLTLNAGENAPYTGVIDKAAGFLYFGTYTVPGKVVKIAIATFTRVGAVNLNTGENFLNTAVIDPTGGFAYFATWSSPGKIVKIALSSFTRVANLTLNAGENYPFSSFIDVAGGFAYFGTATAPGSIVKVALATFTRSASLTLNAGENYLYSGVADLTNGYAYFSTYTAPGWIVKVQIHDLLGITITSSPATGAGYVTVDGVPITTPTTYPWSAGTTHTLAALSPIGCGPGCQYVFSSWSDGGAQSHVYTVPATGTTVTATYTKVLSTVAALVTVATNVTGTGFVTVDAAAITTPLTYNWTMGAVHVLSANTAISCGAGCEYDFVSWTSTSIGTKTTRAINYTVPATAETVTANYKLFVFGLLRATSNPAVPSTIYLNGIPRDDWALAWVKLAPGSYKVHFGDVQGFFGPSDQTIVITAGATTTVVGTFTAVGFLHVVTNPPTPGTIYVDNIARNDWGVWFPILPGSHVVSFGAVANMTTPPNQTVTVTAGSTTIVTGNYVAGVNAGPTNYGFLRAVSNPAIGSTIFVNNVPMNDWGLDWVKLAPGTYTVHFTDVAGYLAPANQTIVITAGATTIVTGNFTAIGYLHVLTNAGVPATVYINGQAADDWAVWVAVAPGTYTISFGDVYGKTTPAPQTVVVTAGATATVNGVYV